jgi:hypothetical protein
VFTRVGNPQCPSRTRSIRRGCQACAGLVVTPASNSKVCGVPRNPREALLGSGPHSDKTPT